MLPKEFLSARPRLFWTRHRKSFAGLKGGFDMSTQNKVDKSAQAVIDLLRAEYGSKHPRAKIEAYRYNPASVRVRIIDPDFKGIDPIDREELVWPIIDRLPDGIISDITALVLITPTERMRTPMSLEF